MRADDPFQLAVDTFKGMMDLADPEDKIQVICDAAQAICSCIDKLREPQPQKRFVV
jgi:hypothetical protein